MNLRLCPEDMERLAILIAVATKRVATSRYAVELTMLDGNGVVVLTEAGKGNLTPIVNNCLYCGSDGSITYELVDGGEVTNFFVKGEKVDGHFRRILATDVYPLVGHGSMSESKLRV